MAEDGAFLDGSQVGQEVIAFKAPPRKRSRNARAERKPDAGEGADGPVAGEERFLRGEAPSIEGVKDKKLKAHLRHTEGTYRDAARSAARAAILLTEEAGSLEAEGMAKTFKFAQRDISKNVDRNSARKVFDLSLTQFGPYVASDWTRNGKYLLFAGRKGHIAMMFYDHARLTTEFHVKEVVRDVAFLHSEDMFAVAQKTNVYIYDKAGTELHCLRNHPDVYAMQFLPMHFLLATVGRQGMLRYQDTSTGAVVAELRTRLGHCEVMRQNPYNAVLHLGHANGTVTLWSPNVTDPLAKIMCHRGPVRALSMSPDGTYMATAGADSSLKIWDVRMFKEMHVYQLHRPASTLDISQKGILAVGFGAQLWKDALATKAQDPYMNHRLAGTTMQDVAFRPFDDVLVYAHDKGVGSMLVPGAGEPNFDAFDANPFETRKQAREGLVHSLLDKLQPDMIVLDPSSIGGVDRATPAVLAKERREAAEARAGAHVPEEKRSTRGSLYKKAKRRKRANIITAEQDKRKKKQAEDDARLAASRAAKENKPKGALSRFA